MEGILYVVFWKDFREINNIAKAENQRTSRQRINDCIFNIGSINKKFPKTKDLLIIMVDQLQQQGMLHFLTKIYSHHYLIRLINFLTQKPKFSFVLQYLQMDVRELESSYVFSLVPIHNNLHFKKPTELNLAPIKIKNQSHNIFPKFNNDGKHYTPAFVLQADIHHQIKQIYMQKLQKAEQSTVGVSEMEVCPPTQNKYCSVCRFHYQNYTNHVRSEVHKKKSDTSGYKQHIEKLCNQFSSSCKVISSTKLKRRGKNLRYRQNNQGRSESLQINLNQNVLLEGNGQNPSFLNVSSFINIQLNQIQAKQIKYIEGGFNTFNFFQETAQF